MKKRFLLLPVSFILSACSDVVPIKLSQEQQQYIGAWQRLVADESETSLKVDNMLLIINEDASAIFRRCEINKTITENGSRSSSSSADFSSAMITELTSSSITVGQTFGWFGFDEELVIDKAPYQDNQHWFLELDGKKLSKLPNSHIQVLTNWVCPNFDEEN